MDFEKKSLIKTCCFILTFFLLFDEIFYLVGNLKWIWWIYNSIQCDKYYMIRGESPQDLSSKFDVATVTSMTSQISDNRK